MATEPEIKDKFPLPVWLKSKPTKDFEAFPGSPPDLEDSFFYIRYPKSENLLGKTKTEEDVPRILTQTSGASHERDWSKHTKPCQDVMHGITPVNTAVNPVSSKPKAAGTDDGFKGEGAACGTSIVKVAQNMIQSSRSSGRGFAVAQPQDDSSPSASPPPHPSHPRMGRRDSKSAPVSPTGSPTSRRKNQTNRYFTSPFEPVPDGSGRSWLTAALLGFKKDLTTSTSTLAEEDAFETRLAASTLAESVESLGPMPKSRDPPLLSQQQSANNRNAPAFRPKPSEFREMNFWSPTSM